MHYGYFVGAGSDRIESDVNTYVLSSPAVIVQNRTLVPLRAISEGLGRTVEWIDAERMVRITTPDTNTAEESAPLVVTSTPWFEIISAARAQSMYDNDEKFVLVYFSGDPSSRMLIPLIQNAARDSGVKTYGVDARAPDADNLRFIWKYTSRENIQYPAVFRVFGIDRVGVTIRPNHQNNLANSFRLFFRDIMDDPDEPWDGSPTPAPNLNIEDTINIRFLSIDLAAAERKREDGDRFIFVYYRSSDPHSDGYMNRIKRAAIEAEVDIFGTDAAMHSYPVTHRWWGNPDGRLMFPTVYFISNGRVTHLLPEPDDRTRLVNLFRAH
jgi:hypothetical protein